MNADTLKRIATLLGTLIGGRTAFQRLQQAREDSDGLELADAVLNMLVVVSGVLILVRRLRQGHEEL